MKAVAHLRHLRIAPRKIRLVINLIRGKNVEDAQRILHFTVKRGVIPVLKTLNSAIANAKDVFQAEETNLYIVRILVNEGSKLKRFRPRARGAASPIQKKTSHITIEVQELKEKKEPKKQKKAVAQTENIKEEKRNVKEKQDKPRFKEIGGVQGTRSQKGMQRMFRRKNV